MKNENHTRACDLMREMHDEPGERAAAILAAALDERELAGAGPEQRARFERLADNYADAETRCADLRAEVERWRASSIESTRLLTEATERARIAEARHAHEVAIREVTEGQRAIAVRERDEARATIAGMRRATDADLRRLGCAYEERDAARAEAAAHLARETLAICALQPAYAELRALLDCLGRDDQPRRDGIARAARFLASIDGNAPGKPEGSPANASKISNGSPPDACDGCGCSCINEPCACNCRCCLGSPAPEERPHAVGDRWEHDGYGRGVVSAMAYGGARLCIGYIGGSLGYAEPEWFTERGWRRRPPAPAAPSAYAPEPEDADAI